MKAINQPQKPAKKTMSPYIITTLTVIFTAAITYRPLNSSFAADPNQNSNATDSNQPSQKKVGKEKPPRPTHDHPAFKERFDERKQMVQKQIIARGVNEPNLVKAMKTVPRHAFVRRSDRRRAYKDHPLPIGMGQTISQPYIVAYMTKMLDLEPNDVVLEIGTGSGYQAAVAAEIAAEVYSIEIIKSLANSAEKKLKTLGYKNVQTKQGDGYFGWQKKQPFDAIIITAATPLIPPPLIKQLKNDAKMLLPLGNPFGPQRLVLITKNQKGDIKSKSLLPVRFVPMTGKAQQKK